MGKVAKRIRAEKDNNLDISELPEPFRYKVTRYNNLKDIWLEIRRGGAYFEKAYNIRENGSFPVSYKGPGLILPNAKKSKLEFRVQEDCLVVG